ncbi:E3 binding domain-containing protein [Sphingomonas sp. MMS24-JH45]
MPPTTAGGYGNHGATPVDSDAPAALSPSVRRAVLEHGVDPATVKGTGKDGRITKEDVAAAASSKPAAPTAPAPRTPAPSVAASTGRREERVRIGRAAPDAPPSASRTRRTPPRC